MSAWRMAEGLDSADKELLHLPVIDDEGSVVGLETIQELLFRRKKNNRVLLMAGGFGKRLYPLTKEIPKPLLPIGGRPILEMIVEQLAEEGFYDFIISVHYKADQIRAFKYARNGVKNSI